MTRKLLLALLLTAICVARYSAYSTRWPDNQRDLNNYWSNWGYNRQGQHFRDTSQDADVENDEETDKYGYDDQENSPDQQDVPDQVDDQDDSYQLPPADSSPKVHRHEVRNRMGRLHLHHADGSY